MLYDGDIDLPPEFAVRFSLLTYLILTSVVAAAEPVRITTDGSFKQHLQWSPDGTTIAFTITQTAMPVGIWAMRAPLDREERESLARSEP